MPSNSSTAALNVLTPTAMLGPGRGAKLSACMLGRVPAPGRWAAAYLSGAIVPRKYMQIGTPSRPNRPKSSPPKIGARSITFASPRKSRKTPVRRRVSGTSLIVEGVYSSSRTRTSGSGALAPRAAALHLRSMALSTWSRTPSLVERTVSCNFTSFGMMLCLVPPWIDPTVTTTGSVGFTSRDAIVCKSRIIFAANTMGSTVVCGAAPCPPLPLMVTSTVSTLASASPSLYATWPTGRRASQCSATP